MSAAAEKAMRPITLLRTGVKVEALVEELAASPKLWNRNVFRTVGQGYNPHGKLSDIIVRFNHWKNWHGNRSDFNTEHESVWWEAYDKLPAVKPMVFDLMRMMEAEALGMVLITRIPARTICDRHVDKGWHAEHYLKFGVQLKAAPKQLFCYDDYELETRTGDLFMFDNSRPHWVVNPTDEERITLIICLRLKQPTCYDCHWDGKP